MDKRDHAPGEPDAYGGWAASAQAWVALQGEEGDFSRREVLDPALDEILGDISGLRIVDIGCGEGRYSRLMASRGARVSGIDPVEAFIAIAKQRDPASDYRVGRGEELPYADGAFDVVLSYLSLVDIPDCRAAAGEMGRVVSSSGRIVVVSVANYNIDGWRRDSAGNKLYYAVDRYMDERPVDLNWKGVSIRNYHRPLSAVLGAFFDCGVVMDGFFEPLPSPQSPAYADERRAPCFQIMTFRKPPR